MIELLKSICRLLEAILYDGFGDGADSKTDTVSIGLAQWTPVITASRPSILRLHNPGAAAIFLSLTGQDTVGAIMPALGTDIWDRFEGALYARGPAGSTINYMLIARRLLR